MKLSIKISALLLLLLFLSPALSMRAYAQKGTLCDSVAFDCQGVTTPCADESSYCHTPCRSIAIQNNGQRKITKVTITCIDPTSLGMMICSAFKIGTPIMTWMVNPPGLQCLTSGYEVTPPALSPLANGQTLLINECGCCKFDLVIEFEDGTTCEHYIHSNLEGCFCN